MCIYIIYIYVCVWCVRSRNHIFSCGTSPSVHLAPGPSLLTLPRGVPRQSPHAGGADRRRSRTCQAKS